MFESDADRLGYLQAAGEQFDTGKPTRMWAVFDVPSVTSDGFVIPVKNRVPQLSACRAIDIAAHEIIKQSPITRIKDGTRYFVRDIDYDDSGDMAVVYLSGS